MNIEALHSHIRAGLRNAGRLDALMLPQAAEALLLDAIATVALAAVPDGWVKVDGRWEFVVDEHVLQVEPRSWHIAHSLACRLSQEGMSGCPIHVAVENAFERDLARGHRAWPIGRYRATVAAGGSIAAGEVALEPLQ